MILRTHPSRVAVALALLLSVLCVPAWPKAKEPAPRFNARSTDGEKFTNDSIKGKVVLLEFWTTWCPYCFAEAPIVDKLNAEYKDSGLLVLTVNVGESQKTVKKYLDQHPRSTKIVLTHDTNLAAMYEAVAYPIYVVIDRDGNIVGTQRGARGERALRNMLADAGIGTRSGPVMVDDEDDDPPAK